MLIGIFSVLLCAHSHHSELKFEVLVNSPMTADNTLTLNVTSPDFYKFYKGKPSSCLPIG